MVNIHHRPIFDTQRVIKHYSEKDGVPISYVCTSAIASEAQAMDIFYRNTPHPEFGNRYFGLRFVSTGPEPEQRQLWISNADAIEDVEFGMKQVNEKWHYSQHRHDFYSVGPVSIDGGRAYFRVVGDMGLPTKFFEIKDGEFVEKNEE